MNTILEHQAKQQGLGRLTTPYKLPSEQWMLENAINDMKRGGIKHAIVRVPGGVELWRANITKPEKP